MVTSLLLRMPSSASPSTSLTSTIETPSAVVPVSSFPNHSFAHLQSPASSARRHGLLAQARSRLSAGQSKPVDDTHGSTPLVRQCQFLIPVLRGAAMVGVFVEVER